MMYKKKGFVVSQAMVYAFGMIVVALIFFWGYKSLSTFSTAREKSELNSFSLKFTKDMETIAYKTGSVKTFDYDVPLDYELFCVFDVNKVNLSSTIMQRYPEIKDSVKDKTDNVFLISKKNIFPLQSDFVTASRYPYYQCQKVVVGTLSVNAKGAVYNGEIAAQILIDAIVKKNLKGTMSGFAHIPGTNEFTATSNSKFFSVDGFAYMDIPSGTKVILPGNNDSLYIEILRPGEDSETYEFGPAGTKFFPPIEIGIFPKSGPCNKDSEYSFGDKGLSDCKEGFAVFDFGQI